MPDFILVIVRRAGWSKSPWDSYTRQFDSEEEFLAWWTGMQEDSYTKKVSRAYDRVRVIRCSADVTENILAPAAITFEDAADY
jgi:hypothetical protein